MAVDDRMRAPGQHEPEGSKADSSEVVLPEHASAYFSPRTPPTSTSHQTLETEAIRLDPAIDPDEAPTQPLKIDGLRPPPWLGTPLQSDAPTVLVPIVLERRRRRRFLAAVAAALVGVVGGIVYGLTRPLPPGRVAAVPPVPAVRSPREASTIGSVAPTVVERGQVGSTRPEMPSRPPEDSFPAVPGTTQATAPPPLPTGHGASKSSRPMAAASGTPSAWLKSEPPKPWFK